VLTGAEAPKWLFINIYPSGCELLIWDPVSIFPWRQTRSPTFFYRKHSSLRCIKYMKSRLKSTPTSGNVPLLEKNLINNMCRSSFGLFPVSSSTTYKQTTNSSISARSITNQWKSLQWIFHIFINVCRYCLRSLL